MRLAAGIGTVLLLANGTAGAQTTDPAGDDSEEPPIPRYRIELIIFTHTDGNPDEEIFGDPDTLDVAVGPVPAELIAIETFETATGADAPPRVSFPGEAGPSSGRTGAGLRTDTRPRGAGDTLERIEPFGAPDGNDGVADAPPRTGADRIADFATAAAARAALQSSSERATRILRADELQLGDAYAIINRLGAYQVLAYGGWEQDGVDETLAQPVDLAYLGATNPQGTILVSVRRFLRVALDLRFRARPTSVGFEPGVLGDIDFGKWYRLQTERSAIRSGELHYIDHPLFGVLVLITPAPEDDAPIEDDTAVLAPAA